MAESRLALLHFDLQNSYIISPIKMTAITDTTSSVPAGHTCATTTAQSCGRCSSSSSALQVSDALQPAPPTPDYAGEDNGKTHPHSRSYLAPLDCPRAAQVRRIIVPLVLPVWQTSRHSYLP